MVKSLLHIPRKQARNACQPGTIPFSASKAPLTIAESSDNMTVKNNPVRIAILADSCILNARYEISRIQTENEGCQDPAKNSRSARNPTIYNDAIVTQVKKTRHDVRKKQSPLDFRFSWLSFNSFVLARCVGRERQHHRISE